MSTWWIPFSALWSLRWQTCWNCRSLRVMVTESHTLPVSTGSATLMLSPSKPIHEHTPSTGCFPGNPDHCIECIGSHGRHQALGPWASHLCVVCKMFACRHLLMSMLALVHYFICGTQGITSPRTLLCTYSTRSDKHTEVGIVELGLTDIAQA